MTRKRKRPARSLPKARAQHREITLESARNHLRAGRFREAIAGFKALRIKDPDSGACMTGLTDAYEGRAQQLEAKGMLKEALVIWENRNRLYGATMSAGHIVLLLKYGRIDEALTHYRDTATLEADAKRTIRVHLAAHYLGGATTFDQVLAADDPVLIHGAAARNALAAYCESDDEALRQALAAIPFRSPYRGFVQILKALCSAEQAPDQAVDLLARIADSSAFANLSNAVKLALSPARTLPKALHEALPHTRKLIYALHGWSPARQALCPELQRLGDKPSVKSVQASMKRHRKALGNDWFSHYDIRLALAQEPSHGWMPNSGHHQRSELEASHLEALQAESERDPWDITDAWEEYAAHLLGDQAPAEPGSDTALYAAAALRRPESIFGKLARATSKPAPESLDEVLVEQLERSLRYDPDDTDCHLRLIRYYRKTAQLKDARRLLNQAQQRWPKHKQVLIEAMETALAGNAYKKAAAIARDILAIDPINSGVRERLVAAHLAHARKHLRGKRPDLAAKSVDAAALWANSERACERMELVRGFVTLAGDAEQGKAALRTVAEGLGEGLVARLALALEAERSGHSITGLLKQLDLHRSPKAEKCDVLDFFKHLREQLDAGESVSKDIPRVFDKPLKQAARLDLEKGQFESVCETLRRANMDNSRVNFAKAALKRWRREPVFEFHAFDAEHSRNGLRNITDADIGRLEAAQKRARTNGDMRLVERIGELISEFDVPFDFAPPLPRFDSDRGAQDDSVPPPIELIAGLIGMLGADGFWNLLKANNEVGEALREMQQEMGKPLFRALVERVAEGVGDEVFNPFGGNFPPIDIFPKPKARTRKRKPKKTTPDQGDMFE